MITTWASATAAASAGVASYSSGSALGSSMIEVTSTRSPPTAAAMLPYTSVEATTEICPPAPALAGSPDADAVGSGSEPHPAAASATMDRPAAVVPKRLESDLVKALLLVQPRMSDIDNRFHYRGAFPLVDVQECECAPTAGWRSRDLGAASRGATRGRHRGATRAGGHQPSAPRPLAPRPPPRVLSPATARCTQNSDHEGSALLLSLGGLRVRLITLHPSRVDIDFHIG